MKNNLEEALGLTRNLDPETVADARRENDLGAERTVAEWMVYLFKRRRRRSGVFRVGERRCTSSPR